MKTPCLFHLTTVVCLLLLSVNQGSAQKPVTINTSLQYQLVSGSLLPGFSNALGYVFNKKNTLAASYVITLKGVQEFGLKYTRTYAFNKSKWSISGNVQASFLTGDFIYSVSTPAYAVDLHYKHGILFSIGPEFSRSFNRKLNTCLSIGFDMGRFTSFTKMPYNTKYGMVEQKPSYTSIAANFYIALKYKIPFFRKRKNDRR